MDFDQFMRAEGHIASLQYRKGGQYVMSVM